MTVQWVFDPAPPSGRRTGGRSAEFSFEGEIDTLVRESVQNSLDARKSEDVPAEMKFRVIDLTGTHRNRFLQAIDWPSLQDNLLAVPDKRGGKPIKANIDYMRDKDLLRLLVIEDRNTKGLSGTEQRQSDDEKNSFCALVRDELYSDKEGEDSGGSFGLGKSLLWAYSGLKTVLFASIPMEPPDSHEGLRFIGRTCLPYHETKEDGKCSGDGWLGVAHDMDELYTRHADSVWGAEAISHSRDCYCIREQNDHGLSAVIVGFTEPGEPDTKAEQIAEKIVHASLESFWPAIAMNRLNVSVETQLNDEDPVQKNVNPSDHEAYKPAVKLLQNFGDGNLEERSRLEAGQAALCWVEINLPKRMEDPKHSEIKGKIAVLVQLLEDDPLLAPIKDKIFRFRRPGMVVRSKGGQNLSIAARPYVAAVLGGRASGEGEEVYAHVERFLKAAEPPAHDEWTHNTRAIKESYKVYGTRRKLLNFEQAILQAIRNLVSVPEKKGGTLPQALLKHLRFGTQSGGGNIRFISVGNENAAVDGDRWKFHFNCTRVHEDKHPWLLRIRLKYSVDGGGGDDVRAISKVECDEASSIEISKGDASLVIPAEINQVTVTGETDADSLPKIGTRAAVKLRVDGEKWKEPDINNEQEPVHA